jgi:LysM repeat protein
MFGKRGNKMKRKEAIFVAVLINAGLLLILLISAITSKEEVIQSSLDEAHVFLEKNPESMQPVFSGTVEERAIEAALQESPQVSPIVALPPLSEGVTTPVASSAEIKTEEIIHPLPSLVEEKVPNLAVETLAPAPIAEKKISADAVVVKKGDTLDKIAKRAHTTVSELKRVNHLKSSFLRIGQKLQVPGKKVVAKTVSPEGYSEYYVVKHGDNPWTIAMKHHMKVEELLTLNQMNSEKARHLRPGDKLRVR